MSTEKWQSLTRSELQELAQKKGLTGISRMTKPSHTSADVFSATTCFLAASVPSASIGTRRTSN